MFPQCFGSAYILMRNRIQVRIQLYWHPDPDPGGIKVKQEDKSSKRFPGNLQTLWQIWKSSGMLICFIFFKSLLSLFQLSYFLILCTQFWFLFFYLLDPDLGCLTHNTDSDKKHWFLWINIKGMLLVM